MSWLSGIVSGIFNAVDDAIRGTYQAYNETVSNIVNYFNTGRFTETIVVTGWRQLKSRDIVGLRDGRVQGHNTLTDYTNFTEYPDGAILRLVNATGGNVAIAGLAITGMPVVCHSEAYQWERKNSESIENNGESSIEISNSYIINLEQIESLGDYLQKSFDARPVYGLAIPGCHYEYEIGDVWHLSLSYTINGQVSECELIDTDVEIESISFSRSVGNIGSTRVTCLPPMGAWSKTTSTRSRIVSAGMAQWLNNLDNVILVASSSWTGQSNYFCDGE